MVKRLVLTHICKQYATDTGLYDINLTLGPGSRLSILGPSGSGKTTLLRVIAGLESLDSGTIVFNGVPIHDQPPHQRNFGMMFQEYALFPHLNVFHNIAFGLKMKGMERNAIRSRVQEMLEMTGLKGFEHRTIDDLSGGERQRVALARTLAPQPDLLMLDEPLSSLDRPLRKRLLKELTCIIAAICIPTIFVTHDHEEAAAAGDEIILMKQGKIVQQGTMADLTGHPATPWVKSFIGV